MTEHFHGHRERLRERFREAPHSLKDYELLELLLGYVIRRQDTKPLAKKLLQRFENLRGVLQAPKWELTEIKGAGVGITDFLSLLHEFINRAEEAPLRKRKRILTVADVARLAQKRLALHEHEEMWAAYVDKKNRLKSWEIVAKGTMDAVSVFPDNLFRRAVEIKASGVILVHNHPAGTVQPSWNDIKLTKILQEQAAVMGVLFIDHLIVTHELCYSIVSNIPVPSSPPALRLAAEASEESE